MIPVRLVFLQRCGTHRLSELFDVANAICRNHVLYTEILQLVCVLSHSTPLNVSRSAADGFCAIEGSRINARSVHEYNLLTTSDISSLATRRVADSV